MSTISEPKNHAGFYVSLGEGVITGGHLDYGKPASRGGSDVHSRGRLDDAGATVDLT